jgi:glutamine amidotransferase
MQLVAKKSYENAETDGLGWVDAEVVKFDFTNYDKKLKIPHVGWNNVSYKNNNLLFDGIANNSDFYFVHSYYFKTNEDIVTSTTDYGFDFVSSVNKNNIYACQFHPEKSQTAGLKLIENFVNINGEL